MARNKSNKAWLHEHVTDAYVKRAQVEGYRSRAAYKLQQIAARDKLFKPGMAVVDLGAAPGGWSQIAAQAVAPGGWVLALDILEIDPIQGVTFMRGDFHDNKVLAELEQLLAGDAVDLVLCDLAPNISGIASADQARAVGLAELALDFAVRHLKPQGNFLVKMFHGEGFDPFVKALRGHFGQVLTRKPEASRSRSSEVYLLGKGLKSH